MRRCAYAGVLLCGMAGVSYAGTAEELPDWGRSIMEFIKANEKWALPIIFVLAFGESIAFISLVLPFWGILVALGIMLPNTDISFLFALCAASVGAALGDWVSYSIGFRFRNTIARMWPFTSHPDMLPKGEKYFNKYGAGAIWLARFSGPLRASVPIVAGVAQMNSIKFQLANWPSAFLWAFVLLVIGDFVGLVWPYFYNFVLR